ncbi:MAG TPA: TonB family protein [Candidatus Elarobacter sp.]|jgi:TonB family protein|nr:TonB family protein [Candidatus Elarobacter sp.]
MSLPSPAEYVDLLQHPDACFIDPELQHGQAKADVLGLPRAYRGNYAVAFRLETGSKAYAVRCFTRDVPEVQRRYDAISRFCEAHVDPALCTFEYQANGIRRQNDVFPIVKMEWAPGDRLDTWLTNNHEDRRGLRRVAEGISQIADRLERKGAAHGDLQHGNLVVESGWVRLIDYDGMFVPGLETLRSPVIGHRNYQHPGRTEAQFDAKMDRFSLLVIFIGLNALAGDPTRYARYGCDERILFERSDFERPDESALFHELVQDPTVGNWALALVDACRKSPRGCPSLESVLNGSYLAGVGVVALSAPPKPAATTPPRPASSAPGSDGAPAAPRTPRRGTPAPGWAQAPYPQTVRVAAPQPAKPAPPPGVSAMPASSVPYPAPPVAPGSRRRGMLIAGSVAAAVLLFWHPWTHSQEPPHFATYAGPSAVRRAAAATAQQRRVHRAPASHPRNPGSPATIASEAPTDAPEAVADETPSPKPAPTAKPKRVAVQHPQRRVAAAKQEGPVPVFTVPIRSNSAAADIEDLAQRGRVPAASTDQSGKADARTARAACSLRDQDAAPTSLESPQTPDSLEGRSVTAEVRVKIDAAGHVLAVAIERSSHSADADAAALAAARASAFRPARRNCEAIGGEYSVEFAFN